MLFYICFAFFVPDYFYAVAVGIGKIVWNVQTEPKGYPKVYKGTSRVRFVHSKKAY